MDTEVQIVTGSLRTLAPTELNARTCNVERWERWERWERGRARGDGWHGFEVGQQL